MENDENMSLHDYAARYDFLRKRVVSLEAAMRIIESDAQVALSADGDMTARVAEILKRAHRVMNE